MSKLKTKTKNDNAKFEEFLVKKNDNAKFEEFYFKGYYKGIADFSGKRDKEVANWFRAIFGFINRYYPIKKGKNRKIIEFGCATGAAAMVLRNFGWDVTSTDISNYAVKRADKNHKGIKFLTHDMEKPFKNGKFDLALAFDVIEHLPHPEVGIKNVYNLLNPDGVAIFTTPNDYPHVYNDPTHINVKTPEKWAKIVSRAGFKNVFMKQFAIMPYFYRWDHRLAFILPFAVNFKYVISPVLIIAKK